MEKYYRFAGVDLKLRFPEGRACQNEGNLALFGVREVTDPWCFDYQPVPSMPEPEGTCVFRDGGTQVWQAGALRQIYRGSVAESWENAYLCTLSRGKDHRVLWKDTVRSGPLGVRTVLNGLNVPHLINQAGGCILHCAYIEYQGKAILFTAPSGVGKSTQAELWRLHKNARILNGDRASVRMAEGIPMAEAIPFAGSSEYCVNRSIPLGTLICLAQGKENRIRPLAGAAAFRAIWEGCTVNLWDTGDLASATQTVTDLIRAVPVLRLECTPDRDAVETLDEFLKGR